MDKVYKILVINPGSTSSKLAYYENEKLISEKDYAISVEELKKFNGIFEQLDMRQSTIYTFLDEIGVKKVELDAIAARGPGGGNFKGGAYLVTPDIIEHCHKYITPHASSLAPVLAYNMAQEVGINAYIYDAEGVNEFNEYATLSGLKEFPLDAGSHTLAQKAAARKAAEKIGGEYEEFNFVVAHLGGGLSIAVHDHGKLVDSNSDAYSPERMGGMPMTGMIRFTKACFSGKYTENQLLKMQMGGGGLVSYLGTSDLREVEKRIHDGDKEAEYYFKGMIYQISKEIAAMSNILIGKVDRIVLTGGMAYSKMLTEQLSERVSYIAPIEILAGSFEMESLANGILRVLRGKEEAQIYGDEEKSGYKYE
jgi:butyrate kinase